MKDKLYTQRPDRVLEIDSRFRHVMALALDPSQEYKKGVVRCIINREGDIKVRGYTDRSELHFASETSSGNFSIGEKLCIENESEIINDLNVEGLDFIGLEDPDIWQDTNTNLLHLYFTIPLISRDKSKKLSRVHLGHAVGKVLTSLRMTEPVLTASATKYAHSRAKEVAIAPLNSRGYRFNLFEGRQRFPEDPFSYSVIMVARADNMGLPWEFGPIIFNPKERNTSWIAGHASPGPFFPRDFIDVGKNKVLGILNGREENRMVGNEVRYGMFSVGLHIYDYEQGAIDWFSPEPFIQDTEAINITFASQFIETGSGKGVLYAHVDDSFVRAYELDASKIRSLIP